MIADAVGRQAFDSVVENVDLRRRAIAGNPRSSPAAPCDQSDGTARVVELQQEAAIDDHLVFGAHRFGDRGLQIFVALVIFVFAVGDHARRRRHRQKGFFDLHALQRGLEVVDVALKLGLAGIFDRADADCFGRRGDAFVGVELGVEFREIACGRRRA